MEPGNSFVGISEPVGPGPTIQEPGNQDHVNPDDLETNPVIVEDLNPLDSQPPQETEVTNGGDVSGQSNLNPDLAESNSNPEPEPESVPEQNQDVVEPNEVTEAISSVGDKQQLHPVVDGSDTDQFKGDCN